MAANDFNRRASSRGSRRAVLLAVGCAVVALTVAELSWRHPPPAPPVSVAATPPPPMKQTRAPRLQPAPPLNPGAMPSPLPRLAANDPPDPLPESMPDSPDRVADARRRRSAHLTALFASAGVSYPAREIYLRAFKWEGQLELWARSPNQGTSFRLVHTYPIQCASGRLGPKRREGDGQVPEGFYFVERFNPRSLFHLSLGLNYPNAADLLLTTDPAHPGSDVFIHGNAASAGCLAMGDTAAEEIYLAAWDARSPGRTRPHGPRSPLSDERGELADPARARLRRPTGLADFVAGSPHGLRRVRANPPAAHGPGRCPGSLPGRRPCGGHRGSLTAGY